MLSVLMAPLMVVSIMPVTGSNNIVAKASTASAESSVVTWSADRYSCKDKKETQD